MNYRGKGSIYETEEAMQWAISREGKKYIHIVKRRICETGSRLNVIISSLFHYQHLLEISLKSFRVILLTDEQTYRDRQTAAKTEPPWQR